MSNEIILDCTLRDGGYYTNWHFSSDLVNEYLLAMKHSYVNIVEIGFRSIQEHYSSGPFKFTTDEFLHKLNIPPELMVGVMINGSDLSSKTNLIEILEELFPNPANESPVGLVRIASRYSEINKSLQAALWLKNYGYKVGLNLIHIGGMSHGNIQEITNKVKDYPIDVLYFADSTGSINPKDVNRIIKCLRNNWKGPIGIHAHDNMGLALLNTLMAMDSGTTWLDSTVNGMGRGPGNTKTEELLIETNRIDNIIPLVSLIHKYFIPMRTHYMWGTNIFYYLSGKYGIHPTYIQNILSKSDYNIEDIISIINYLRLNDVEVFNFDILTNAYYHINRSISNKEF